MDLITKTRRRFMLLMMLVTTTITVASLVAMYVITYNSQEANNRKRLNSFEELTITNNGTLAFGSKNSDAYLVEHTRTDIGINFSMLVDHQGKFQYNISEYSNWDWDKYQAATDIAWLGENYAKVEFDGQMWQYYTASATANFEIDNNQTLSDLDEVYQIRFVEISESQQTLQTLAITLCVIGSLLLILFFFFSLFFSKRAIQPLIEVLEKQRQFVADASHELKTPISIIKANCSVLYANDDTTIKAQREWLDNIVTGANRMTNLIHGLIALAKIEGTDNTSIKLPVALGQEIDDALNILDLMIQEKNLRIEIVHHTEALLSDPDRFRQVLNIVLDNALKYANTGGLIRICVTEEKKWLCVSILNTGQGISPENLEKIFDRFFRAEGARTQDGSHGLGLSIAQTVMHQLGGIIKANSVVGENTTFTLRFPKYK